MKNKTLIEESRKNHKSPKVLENIIDIDENTKTKYCNIAVVNLQLNKQCIVT